MPAIERAAFADKYRREQPACDRELTLALTQISSGITDPVLKLRYLRSAIDAQRHEPVVRRMPCAPVRRAWYRWRGRAALNLPTGDAQTHGEALVLRALLCVATYVRRKPRLVAALIAVPVTAACVALGIGEQAGSEPPYASVAQAAADASLEERAAAPIVAEPFLRSAPASNPIWLADRGVGWELYSNGLRIETADAVAGERRQYRVHDRFTGLQPTIYTRPVGILFHTSESDLWPLEPAFRRELRRSGAALLRYLREGHSYNYYIDRFGRVHRLVDDDSRARHAGHAVWARGDEVYLDLNAAFIGVSFESRWEGAQVLPITAAQLSAGRSLTDYLRQRYAIAPEMCVTHGLASVSPRQHLIGYHLDWARGFPFAAFGLPDLYAQPTPSVALFGFGYDARFLRDVGERWPGLTAAENDFARNAAARAMSPAQLRNEGRALYRRWSEEIRSGPGTAGASSIQQSVD